MTEIDLMVDFHKSADRQGPGSFQDTKQALSLTSFPGGMPIKVADIGCGTGGQTMVLAQQIEGEITAVDLFSEFLIRLNEQAEAMGLQEKIQTLESSMDNLPFELDELDLIWSEGAIYNMGFETGIKNWKQFLKPGGYLAISEITWITKARPKEIEDFWQKAYPEIDTASNKIKILAENGFTLVGYFILSPDSWLKNYYDPMEKRFDMFLAKHNHSALAQKIVAEHEEEIQWYKTFKDYYSYGFYVARNL